MIGQAWLDLIGEGRSALAGAMARLRLGDEVGKALDRIGVTKERVQEFLGPECGCDERQARLNDFWVALTRVVEGRDPEGRWVKDLLAGEGANAERAKTKNAQLTNTI